MSIYWVFFKAKGGHEMKLQVDAIDREDAIKLAERMAKGSSFHWVLTKAECCR